MQRSPAALAAYYVATGASPFISRRGFEAVTGPKSEWWLVQTVGLLSLSIGAGVGAAAYRGRMTPELRSVAAGAAASFAAIDVVYVARGRIRATYLIDAVAQIALLLSLTRSGSPPDAAAPGRSRRPPAGDPAGRGPPSVGRAGAALHGY